MRRRPIQRDEGMTLFPFLAVLICTVGALIVLLVVVVQQAKATANATPSADLAKQNQELAEQQQKWKLELEECDWKLQMLEQSRQATANELSEHRLELSHLEDHIRELQRRLKQAVVDATGLKEMRNTSAEDLTAAQDELARLKAELSDATKKLEQAKADLAKRRRSYSIIPYQGPNGTERRPVFIECLDDRVIMQPEGIALFGKDFQPPLGDDNPLAMALRAKREYLSRLSFDQEQGEPYPLLIVRPLGAQSYAAARAAMKSWDSEFGYELVEADLQLEYPPADPALTDLVQQAVDDARQRRAILKAMTRPRRVRGGMLRPSRSGGFVSVGEGSGSHRLDEYDGPTDDGEDGDYPFGDANGNGFDTPHGEADERAGISQGGQPFGDAPFGGERTEGDLPQATDANSPNGNGAGRGRGTGQGNEPPPTSDPPSLAGSSGASVPGETASRGSASRRTGPGNSRFGAEPPMPGTTGARGTVAVTGTAEATGTWAHGTTETPGAAEGRSALGAESTDGTAHLGARRADDSSGVAGESAGGATSATSDSMSSSAGGGGAAGAAGGSMGSSHVSLESLTQRRGTNWGLPRSGGGATGVTRPVQLHVFSNRVVLVPERGTDQQPQTFPIDASIRENIDDVVSALWKRMDSWGIAGPGMYWKPILRVRVAQDAEQNFSELDSLLKGSGILVERASP